MPKILVLLLLFPLTSLAATNGVTVVSKTKNTKTIQKESNSNPIYQRLLDFVRTSPQKYKIYLYDMLGEGEGYFDHEPRYHAHDMNCTTWLQTALAKAYSTHEKKTPFIMDYIRYYHGIVGFSTRVHYTDHWLYLNPGPLKPVKFKNCGQTLVRNQKIDIDFFKKNRKYTCPLYREDFNQFNIEYYSKENLIQCSSQLEVKPYIIFPVSNDQYIQTFGTKSGAMGLVHGLVLDIMKNQSGKDYQIYHASIATNDVQKIEFKEYLNSSLTRMFAGYTVWELDPNWKYTERKLSRAEHNKIHKLLMCEEKL